MKSYTLDSSSVSKPLSPAQRNAMYWRAWNEAETAQPGLNRFAVTTRVLGRVKKITELTDEEFLKLIHAFESAAKKANNSETTRPEKEEAPAKPILDSWVSNSSTPRPLSDHQAAERNRREQIVLQLIDLIGTDEKPGKYSQNQAAKILGESPAVLSRWRRAYLARGVAGLVPQQSENCGRKPKFKLNADEQNALRHCRLRKDSLQTALEDFAEDPDCRPETRALISGEMDRAARERRLPSWPLSLQRAGYVSDDQKAHFRGAKHAQEFEIVERRGMWWIDEKGNELPIVGNTLWESDDMSWNEPFRYQDPEKQATQVGRQSLATMTVFAAAWLGVSPLGRERDAYRLEDIADHLLDVVNAHGLPLIWRFERGPWENSVIDGIKLGDGTRWGGLDHLFRVVHVFKSRSKGLIESSFDLLQSLTAHGPSRTGDTLSIGRNRGEFERATKFFLAAGRGDAGAASHFWEIAAAADGIAAAMLRFNERPKVRRAFGRAAVVPNDLQRTAERRECPVDELWRFCPVKKMATVRGGAVETSVPHYPFPFRFRVNGVDPQIYLERGYSVLIAFHPGRPEEGCHVFNAEAGSRNRDGLKFAEKLMMAPFAEDAPQLNLRPDEYQFVARKNANAAVRSEFRAIVGAGVRGARVSTARDGYGNSAETRNSARRSRTETLHAAGCGVRANPETPVDRSGHASPARAITPFDEDAELARIQRLEREAIERGDILIT